MIGIQEDTAFQVAMPWKLVGSPVSLLSCSRRSIPSRLGRTASDFD